MQGMGRLETHLSTKPWRGVAVMFLAPDVSITKDVIDGLEFVMIDDARQFMHGADLMRPSSYDVRAVAHVVAVAQ